MTRHRRVASRDEIDALVAVKSIRIGDFTADQVAGLYGQHTADTGQQFTPEAIDQAFEYTMGQPWLVNAIAREITQEMRVKPPEPITGAHMYNAKERLILARATHLDYLATRLAEPRVRNVIEPLLADDFVINDPTYNDDVSYVRDLGLIGQGQPIVVANPIYKVRKPYTDADGKPSEQREAIELKIRRQGQGNPLKEGLAQLDEYLTRLGLDTGTLIIFDRRPSAVRKSPNPQFSHTGTTAGRQITLLSA